MKRLILSGEDVRSIKGLLSGLQQQYRSVADAGFLKASAAIACELPRSVRQFLNDFRFADPTMGAVFICGYPVEDGRIGRTPEHWMRNGEVSPTLAEDMLLILYGSLLGDVFSWGTEQGGHIIQDVMPIKSHQHSQMSTGSEQTIWWHTEDAFHPYTSDYVGLVCLRNHDRVATTFACIDAVRLDPQVVKILFQNRFIIRPVESHQEYVNREALEEKATRDERFQRINELNEHPERISILHGDPEYPYLRIDPFYMDIPEEDTEARQALEVFTKTIEGSLQEVVLEPGDCCLIDNYKAVHGRKPFTARYDGTDRWLKRVNITRDLRKSRTSRASVASRIIV
jgi:Fe(II)/alpha-ketoglutarate-dependent arginine beta-hydroxylase